VVWTNCDQTPAARIAVGLADMVILVQNLQKQRTVIFPGYRKPECLSAPARYSISLRRKCKIAGVATPDKHHCTSVGQVLSF
jgi:hypothetical protein